MQTNEMILTLRYLFPAARMPEDIALSDDGTGPRIVAWNLTTPQSTDAELQSALPAAQAQAEQERERAEVSAMLDERYRLFNRANASGNPQDAADIQAEIKGLLDYKKELN